jgi:hypothetical protein
MLLVLMQAGIRIFAILHPIAPRLRAVQWSLEPKAVAAVPIQVWGRVKEVAAEVRWQLVERVIEYVGVFRRRV